MSSHDDITYDPSEAAYYARLNPATVRAWLRGRLPFDDEAGETPVGFSEFVQLLAVRELRLKGISLAQIRDTMNHLREDCGIRYPFASPEHRSLIEGKRLFVRIEGEEHVYSATGRERFQLQMRPIAELYMTKLEFNDKGVVTRFRAHDFENERITISPGEAYGQPIIAETGHNAFSLADAVQAEGGFDEAAEIFGVSRIAVVAACDYVDSLQPKPKPQVKLAA